jgi:hypothetical protein
VSHIIPNVSYDGLCPSHLGACTSYPIYHVPMHVHIYLCSGASKLYSDITYYGGPHPQNPYYPFPRPLPRLSTPQPS